jgi:hypothetical protein
MSEHLDRLAKRVEHDPFFLAAALNAYARSSRSDDPALAARLGCPTEVLTRLRLCRMPTPVPPAFWQDIAQIASAFGIDPDELAVVVRQGQSLVSLRSSNESRTESPCFLLAARDDDRDPTRERPPPSGEEPR